MGNRLSIKGIELNSRFFFAPINTGLSSDGNPTDELINFHKLRSNLYTGINYVGNVAIDYESVTNDNTLYINSEMPFYSELASAIDVRGSIPGVQIGCLKTSFETRRNWKNSNPSQYKEHIRSEIKGLPPKQIESLISSFQNGIIKLVNAGFKVIQIHGAHGYMLNNFLSKTYNLRDDEYGKDKTLILKQILLPLQETLKSTIVDLRVSLFEDDFDTKLTYDQLEFIENLYHLDVIDMISISNGIYNINKKLIYPSKGFGCVSMLELLLDYIKLKNQKIWNLCGNVRSLQELNNLENHITFSIGRPVIADHDFIKKQLEGRNLEINECIYGNKCHYFSIGRESIECSVNTHLY